MARSALRLLQNSFHSERRNGSGYIIGLVPHNRNNFARLHWLTSAHDVLDQRPAACAMQHFCQRGF
jgi:hypothetical protein